MQEEVSERSNIRLVRFVNTGHHIHREQKDEFLQLVKGFFGEN